MEKTAIKCLSNENLILDQSNKQKYFLQYKDLKFHVSHGRKVMKLLAVYQFQQPSWLAKGVKQNAGHRLEAKSKIKNFSAEKWLFLSAEKIKEHRKTCDPSFDG